MATWREIGIENCAHAVLLRESKAYRSAISRCYYGVFSLLTFELDRRGARRDFAANRATPGHRQLPDLIDRYFLHISDARRKNMIREITSLYGSRIESDYQLKRMDRDAADDALQSARRIAKYLGVAL